MRYTVAVYSANFWSSGIGTIDRAPVRFVLTYGRERPDDGGLTALLCERVRLRGVGRVGLRERQTRGAEDERDRRQDSEHHRAPSIARTRPAHA